MAASSNSTRNLGPYTLIDRVGSGGMGTVWRGLDRRSSSLVAVKVLHEAAANDPSYLERFRREAHVASLLRSPYTVRVLDFGQDNGQHYLVSEFIDGENLGALVGRGRIEAAQAVAIATQVALALDDAEAHQVVHRDIKPENILIAADGTAKVTDFGISTLTYASSLTTPGMFIGSVAYAAPEQHRGSADTRADIYSLGVVLFEMLSGRAPFKAETATGLMRMHEESPVPFELIAGVQPRVVDVVRRCLEKKPGHRFGHARELVAALSALRMEPAAVAATRIEATPAFGETRVGESPAAPVAMTRVDDAPAADATRLDAASPLAVVAPAFATRVETEAEDEMRRTGEFPLGLPVAFQDAGVRRLVRRAAVGAGIVAAATLALVFAMRTTGTEAEATSGSGGQGILPNTLVGGYTPVATKTVVPKTVTATPSTEPTQEPTPIATPTTAPTQVATQPPAPSPTAPPPPPPTATPTRVPPTATPTTPPPPPAPVSPKVTNWAFCRSSLTCANGAEQLVVGDYATVVFNLNAIPAAGSDVWAEVFYNGQYVTEYDWYGPYTTTFFFLAYPGLGFVYSAGTVEVDIYVDGALVGTMTAQAR